MQIKRLSRLVLLAAAVLVAAAGYYAVRPLKLPTLPLEFSLKQGMTLTATAREIEQAGIPVNGRMFILLARMLGKSTQIKPGNYQLEKPVSLLELIDIVSTGQMTRGEISIIEGWTFSQFRAAMNEHPAIRHDSEKMSDGELLQVLGIPDKHPEGLFFPDTYYFSSGTSDLVILKRAYQTMQENLQESWQQRAPNLPLKSPYQALILASIVEKETGQANDRGMIAAVFTNRLRKGMRLQSDPTVIYGMGNKFDGNLRSRDLVADTPYNTYTRVGLPPTPIALPGLAAIQAALHPEQTDALYFVARGDGSSEFSRTLLQHNRAVNKYQK